MWLPAVSSSSTRTPGGLWFANTNNHGDKLSLSDGPRELESHLGDGSTKLAFVNNPFSNLSSGDALTEILVTVTGSGN